MTDAESNATEDAPGGDVRSTPIGQMRLVAPGVIVHRLEEGISVGESDAAVVKRLTEELAAGHPVVMVVDMRAVAFAGRDARDAFQEGAGGVEIGTALVTDRGFSDKLAGLFVRYSQPSRPVEIFLSESDAIAWAQSLLAEHS
jgi:hypothetical protein